MERLRAGMLASLDADEEGEGDWLEAEVAVEPADGGEGGCCCGTIGDTVGELGVLG